tara:strand:- start:1022 stop:1174 length:153 start_codon:yes stop_codon:yes gene_type:complete
MTEQTMLDELEAIAVKMGGTCTHSSTLNSQGRSSKVVKIEYDVQMIPPRY